MARKGGEGAPAAAPRKGMGPVPLSLVTLSGLSYGWKEGLLNSVPAGFEHEAQWVAGTIAGICALQLLLAVGRFRLRYRKALDAVRPKFSTHSARMATVKDIEDAGLVYKPGVSRWLRRLLRRAENTVEFYCGIVGRYVLKLPAVHMLILAPSGTGKNRNVLNNLLALVEQSAVVNDIKLENYLVSAGYRASKLGHRIILLSAGGVHKYNPLDNVTDALASRMQDVFVIARMIAQFLAPEPKDDKNSYWRQGGRDMVILAIVGLCLKFGYGANLTMVQALVTVPDDFINFCEDLEFETALSGEVAIFSRGMLSKFERTPKAIQEYSNVATQALAIYGPSGVLSKLTESSTFRYRDLRKPDAAGRRLTIYQHFDSSRRAVFEPFGALLNACMVMELERNKAGEPIVFFNDEAANFVIKDLPKLTTIVRGEIKLHFIIVVQGTAQMRDVWGNDGTQTIMDNCDLKLMFGLSTPEECQKVSDMIGQENVLSPSYALGQGARDGVGESRSIAQRPVMSPEMVRRQEKGFLFYRKARPALVDLPGSECCEPARSGFDVNTLYGNKKLVGPLQANLLTGKVWKKFSVPEDPLNPKGAARWALWRAIKQSFEGTSVNIRPVVVLGLCWMVAVWGMPHFRWQFSSFGRGPSQVFRHCEYVGLTTFRTGGPDCPIIKFRPWSELNGGQYW